MFDNTQLFLQIYQLGNQNYFLDRIFIFGANELIFIAFFIVALLIIFGSPKERQSFLLIIIGLLLAETFMGITQLIYAEPRPYLTLNIIPLIEHVPSPAFPSGHTTMAGTIAFAYLFTKSKYTLLFLLIMIWIGFSRIFVGVHYPLDVIGGIIYSLISIFLASRILDKFLES